MKPDKFQQRRQERMRGAGTSVALAKTFSFKVPGPVVSLSGSSQQQQQSQASTSKTPDTAAVAATPSSFKKRRTSTLASSLFSRSRALTGADESPALSIASPSPSSSTSRLFPSTSRSVFKAAIAKAKARATLSSETATPTPIRRRTSAVPISSTPAVTSRITRSSFLSSSSSSSRLLKPINESHDNNNKQQQNQSQLISPISFSGLNHSTSLADLSISRIPSPPLLDSSPIPSSPNVALPPRTTTVTATQSQSHPHSRQPKPKPKPKPLVQHSSPSPSSTSDSLLNNSTVVFVPPPTLTKSISSQLSKALQLVFPSSSDNPPSNGSKKPNDIDLLWSIIDRELKSILSSNSNSEMSFWKTIRKSIQTHFRNRSILSNQRCFLINQLISIRKRKKVVRRSILSKRCLGFQKQVEKNQRQKEVTRWNQLSLKTDSVVNWVSDLEKLRSSWSS